MKLAVLLPDAAALDSAGARLRYKRLAAGLKAQGHKLDLIALDRLGKAHKFDRDAYIFAKIYDARAPILAQAIKQAGARVGIDLFDDYFSTTRDPRLTHLRRWFDGFRPMLDFALCGTDAMAAQVAPLLGDLPCQVIADPAPVLDRKALAQSLPQKARRARDSKALQITWFGIGDNPYFRLGLADLQAFADQLLIPARQGFDIRLSVLTNRRALTVAGLERLARLPVEVDLQDWSLPGEQAALAASDIAFLPVGAGAFSRTKSSNRALTALAAGAQVLSPGHPLYADFEAFLYRDFPTLLADLETDSLRHRADRLTELATRMQQVCGAAGQAEALAGFLAGLGTGERQPGRVVCVIHGVGSGGDIHKFAQRMRMLSVASSLSRAQLNFDVTPDGDRVLLSERALGLLRPGLATRAEPAKARGDKPTYRLDMPAAAAPAAQEGAALRITDMARYGAGIGQARALVQALFDTPKIILSEPVSPYFEAATG